MEIRLTVNKDGFYEVKKAEVVNIETAKKVKEGIKKPAK